MINEQPQLRHRCKHISGAGHGESSILTHLQCGLSFGSHYSLGRKEVSEEILDALFMDSTRQTRAGREF